MSGSTPEVHAHEVIEMMLTADAPFTRESLIGTIQQKFGTTTRFFSCSESHMDASALVDFLESRGKFQPAGSGFAMDPSRVCQH